MQLVTLFDILERVRIIEIDVPATVLKIQFGGLGVLYQLEYWWNSEIKSVWLYERELAALKTKESANSTQQPQGEICPHYFEATDGVHACIVGQCRCKGKLPPVR